MSWKQRSFESLTQKVEFAKTFALSKLWYVRQVLPLPPSVAKKVESQLSTFLFEGKPELLKLQELFLPVKRGGLGLPEERSRAESLRLKQLCRMLHQEGRS